MYKTIVYSKLENGDQKQETIITTTEESQS